ncbi:MAG: hypothetical protein IJ877_06715 [Candidatus Gastranaerophilales bacterium]|nr:hypothetical protein [Candidatus Gastranaerophilales bacterium]
MESTQSAGTASVSSNPTILPQTTNIKESDTEGIFALINSLNFKVSEGDKDMFFKELESTLENESEANSSEGNYEELINFLMKHMDSNDTVQY